ncbi:hypothetical protein TIFTF001_019633 [Ficus carica]|uniref:Uncharacterized protein n=1 Tax=Ficus carica TaxID=3494 RepID=A0AA88AGS3_FICCA|nr:hypothetical protein TIFTF001_019633 [Ficus carica]
MQLWGFDSPSRGGVRGGRRLWNGDRRRRFSSYGVCRCEARGGSDGFAIQGFWSPAVP